MRKALTYLFFIALVVGCGLAVGITARPDGWYATINKPSFNPPPWVFGPVWTTLYVLIGAAGARSYLAAGNLKDAGMPWWIAQFVFNLAWSPTFFVLHQIAGALVVGILMLIAIIGFIVTRWKADRISAIAFLPYAAWVSFANFLTATLVALN
jgi:tryptophan-rich sensory protein